MEVFDVQSMWARHASTLQGVNETASRVPLHASKPKQPYLLRRPIKHNPPKEQYQQASRGTLRAPAVKVRTTPIKNPPPRKARKQVQGEVLQKTRPRA